MSTSARPEPRSEDLARAASDNALIRVSQVGKTYSTGRGDLHALGPIDLEFQPGEFVSILGPSGCGKSTLLKLVAGLVTCTTGEITIQGAAVNGPVTELGYVFQDAVLLDWRTVIGNIMLQAKVRNLDEGPLLERAHELLSLVGLEGFEDRHPYELSGGMKQRVSICRALVHDPELLLMDEPFGAIDALNREQLNADLQTLWLHSRKTVLFVTHSIPEAVFLADRVVIMSARPGLVVEEVTVDLPRPRPLALMFGTREFDAYTQHIRETLENAGVFTTNTEGMILDG